MSPARLDHIVMKYFLMKYSVASGEVSVDYLPTEDMVADTMTKLPL